METKYPQVRVRLVGEDGNAFSIMGRVRDAMLRAGISQEEVKAYLAESTSGDYDNLLRTAMRWVTCDGFTNETTKHYTKSQSFAMEEYWDGVEDAVQDAVLIAWDTCHKIYLAMDEEQADWFRENYAPDTFTGTPDEMLSRLHEWYDESCSLKFIQSVKTTHGEPEPEYNNLIPQGAEDEECCGVCGASMKQPYADGVCEMCWDSEEEDDEWEDD